MEFLSLKQPTPLAARRLTRAEGILLSLLLHVLLFLLVLYLPGHLPASVISFFRPRPPGPAAASAAEVAAPPALSSDRPLEKPKIPLKFAYVKVPEDRAVEKNPTAPLLSDLNRRARQEVPTPPEVRRFSIDPHSEGDTRDRVRPDPSRPEGPESPDRPEPQPSRQGGGAGASVRREGRIVPEAAGGAAGSASSPPVAGSDEAPSPAGGPDLTQALSDLKSGEYKFTFKNPGYLRDGSYGTLSFDTQGFPWGDYARRLYVIIRNNWLARIPLAAREGIAGYVCQRFVIARDGAVQEIESVRPSSIPPFDKAASDAIRASSPLPPLPPDFPYGREGVTFCFFYNMYPEEAE